MQNIFYLLILRQMSEIEWHTELSDNLTFVFFCLNSHSQGRWMRLITAWWVFSPIVSDAAASV